MHTDCESIQPLMSGLLDGELAEEDRKHLEEHLASCEHCKRELEKMKKLVNAVSGLRIDSPPEEVWDTFLEGVYNRVERKTGWTVFVVGAIALTLYGIYLFVTEPWGPALMKLLVATPVVGLTVVFISILRERLFVAKTDRYSREIKR